MPFALTIHHADGEDVEHPEIGLAETVRLFLDYPWGDEVPYVARTPDWLRLWTWPYFRLIDDSGRALTLTAMSEDSVACGYETPRLKKDFGFYATEGGAFYATTEYPRDGVGALIGRFFHSEEDEIIEAINASGSTDLEPRWS